MYQTTYHRAASIAEASELLEQNEDAKLLAGGQTLIPTMKQRLAAPSDLIDLRHITELKGIAIDGRRVRIGAATTHAEVAADDKLQRLCPGITELAGQIGDPHVRHLGTIGGSIANNDPAADYPAAILALDATIHTTRRDLPAAEFFVSLFETALEPDEIIAAISFMAPERSGYAKFPNPASRYAMVGVYVASQAGGPRVVVTGAGEEGVFRASNLEAMLAHDFSANSLDGAEISPEGLLSDIHASAEYRAHLITVLARRAVNLANA